MSSPDERPVRDALIPWVIALLALFGWNALVPDRSVERKDERPAGVGLSQLTDDLPAPTTIASPLVVLAPAPSNVASLPNLSSVLIGIETPRNLPVIPWHRQTARGRAPPVMWI